MPDFSILFLRLARAARKPPRVIVARIVAELKGEADRFIAPYRARALRASLLRRMRTDSIDTLWQGLARAPFPGVPVAEAGTFEARFPTQFGHIMKSAEAARQRQVDLLGSGPVRVDRPVQWHKDYKSGFDWPARYFRDIPYNNPERPSDVKMAWELSRMQWAIPLGQAYLLTQNDRDAAAIRELLEEWIDANPYAASVNWACTMEVALRIFSWTWFFHVFKDAPSWRDPSFRERFLATLYLHAEFTERNIERSDVNGNHFTADASALAWAGLFFDGSADAARWLQAGCSELERELPLQVGADGVDFEASSAYHRLVLELFLFPAIYMKARGRPLPASFREALCAMARFSLAYSRPDGTCVLWGDADDARTLPFGTQDINDHRYLAGLVALTFDDDALLRDAGGPQDEAWWWFGSRADALPAGGVPGPCSTRFADAGVLVMRNDRDHVFIDCGPIGLAGRGGHGHNDCLAFEAVLDGSPLVRDCGAYLYTANFDERNAFRSTAYHNTPQVDGEEINRLIRPDFLWNMHYDAVPDVRRWHVDEGFDIFEGAHAGYQRLPSPVTPCRTIMLDHRLHALTVIDRFIGDGMHAVSIPLHLAPGVHILAVAPGRVTLEQSGRQFSCVWSPDDGWTFSHRPARVSPSYGKVVPVERLEWRHSSGPLRSLRVTLFPAELDEQLVIARADDCSGQHPLSPELMIPSADRVPCAPSTGIGDQRPSVPVVGANKRKFHFDFASTLLTRFAAIAAGLVGSVLTARFLGPAGRGEYFLCLTLITFALQFGNLGLAPATAYWAARQPALARSLSANAIWISVLVGLPLGVIVSLAGHDGLAWVKADTGNLAIAALSLPFGLYSLIVANVLIGQGRIHEYNLIEVMVRVSGVAALVLAAFVSSSPGAFLAAAGLVTVLNALLLANRTPARPAECSYALFVDCTGYASRSWIANLLGYAVSRYSSFPLSHMVGTDALGIWSIAMQIGDALLSVPAALGAVLLSRVVRADNPWLEMRYYLTRAAVLMAGICLAVAAVGQPLITSVFGAAFKDAYLQLLLMLPGIFFLSLTSVVSQYLGASRLPFFVLAVWAAGLMLQMLLVAVWIPTYGAYGVMGAISATYAFVFLALWGLAWRHARARGLHPIPSI